MANHPHNYYNSPPSTAWMATVADSVGLGLLMLVILARCYTKLRITKAPGWEDCMFEGHRETPCLTSLLILMDADTILVAYGFFIAMATLEYIHRFHYGGGRHSYDLPPEYYQGWFGTNVLRTFLYVIGITLAKLSLLFFLYRIFRVDRKFRIASWIIGAVLLIWSAITLLLKIFACRPVRASFDLHLYMQPSTTCPIKTYVITNIHGFCNIFTDFAILILPIPMVWKLHVTPRKKAGLAAVFATGLFICAVAIVRQYILYNTSQTGDGYHATRIKVWMSLEFSFSILVASLPTLTPLFKKFSTVSTWLPTLRSKIMRSNNHASSKGIKISGGEPDQDQDIERNALRSDGHPPASWQTPRAWKKAGGRSGWDEYHHSGNGETDDGGATMRSESDITLQDLQPVDGGKRRGEGAVGGAKL
ncbi:MAG: hypothetical protein LQ339_008461 [Xanthoria mediterranea]|nr:MAG: hypothetical protein LQ339_008461 [Xanthoria mediterranea]